MKFGSNFALTVLFLMVGVASAQQPVSTKEPMIGTESAKGYLLGPGDEISGQVLGEPQFSFVATVNEDGNIMVPFFDKPIVAKCRTEKELKADLVLLLEKQLRNPQFGLNTKRDSRPPATVYGEVRTPKHYDLKRKATLRELIAYSGGPTEEASGVVEVVRTQAPLCAGDVDDSEWKSMASDPLRIPIKTYRLADLDKVDPVIYPGDVIHLQKSSPVYVVGEVMFPQGIYLKDRGITVMDALNMVGGVRREAKTKDIKVYRLKNGDSKEREVLSANLDLIRKGQQKDVLLQPYDIIEVDKSKDSIAETIFKFAIGAGKAAISAGATGAGYRVVY